MKTIILQIALGACASGAAFAPCKVAAQPWVVVPVVVATEQEAQLDGSYAARPFAEALAEHARVVPLAIARERFETRGSSAPVAATHSDLDQIARDAQLALYHVAMGLYGTASGDVERVMVRADRALESLNRESLAARQLLDSCLFIVRARLQARKPEAARAQALECRRLVPDIEPEASVHPPDVIGELAAAEATLETQSPGSLRITSEPSGCPVFIQGRNLGQTPLELPRLTRGEYRVQVECVPGQYGRVHRVTLGPSRSVVHVDQRFDAAVQSSDGVSLRYPNEALERKYAATHGVEIGRAVGAGYVALITPEPPQGGGRVRITAFEVGQGKLLASVIVQLDETRALRFASDAAAALVAGRSLDFTVEPAVQLASEPELDEPIAVVAPAKAAAPVGSLRDEQAEGPGVLAWSLAATGLAAHLAGWVLYAQLIALEDDYRKVRELDDTAEAERRIDNVESFELVPPIVAFGGSALLSASMPWLLDESATRSVPPLALVAGGAGVAVAATGTYLLISGGACDRFDRLGRCDDVPATTRLGAMFVSASLPLLSIPIVYWARSLGMPEHADLALEGSQRHVFLRWRGTL